ncbi:MAG: hypothetical protein PHX30_04355 [Candidatus Pacebacteria bacterium]|nr:hypothetical protein [Candidatus Paceibacterota bacterium]
MNKLLQEVIETNLQIQRKARDLNIRAGKRIFLIMSRSEWKAWLIGRSQGARSVAEIEDFDSLFLPPLDSTIVEKIMVENPDTVEVEGETLEIKYEQDWNNNFICSVKISEEFARHTRMDKIYLPGGRSLKIQCGSYSVDSISELVEKLEKNRIEKCWAEKRRDLEHTSWISNPREVVPYLSKVGKVEISQKEDGSPIFGYLSLYSDSDPDFQIRLRESEEEAEKETRIGLERLLRKDCKDLFAVPEEEPWQHCPSYSWRKRPAGEILEQKLKEIMASVLEKLSSENYAEKVQWAEKEIESIKISLREEYVFLEESISSQEKQMEEGIYSISYDSFVKSEIAQAREQMERAKRLLGEMKYQEARKVCDFAIEVAGPLDFLSRKRRGEYDRANEKWRSVGEYVYNLSEGQGAFREAIGEERKEAEKIQDEIYEALRNNNFDVVLQRVPEIKSWIEGISVICAKREQARREKYPEGVWEAASYCASDDPDEIADKGIELAKACSDLVGEIKVLYLLRSLTKGNKNKYEKQRAFLEFVSGLEETEIGKWFEELHYADDINSAIKVAIAYLESGGKEEKKEEKIENIASQLAAAFGGGYCKNKNKKIKM